MGNVMPHRLMYGDSRVLCSWFPDNCVDMICTDPPYRKISGGNKNPAAPKGVLSENDGRVFRHNDIAPNEYLPHLYRILKPQGQMWLFTDFTNLERMLAKTRASGFEIHNLFVWLKNTMNPNRWGMKNAEYIILARKGKSRALYNPSLPTVIECDTVKPKDKTHPTQKPVELIRKLVEASSLPGQIVFDPFGGSGTILEAAYDRQVIMCEIDPTYVAEAHTRRVKLERKLADVQRSVHSDKSE